MAAVPTTIALWSSDFAASSVICGGRADGPGLLGLDQVVEPRLDVGGLEAQAVRGEQRLALLADPGLEQVRRCTSDWNPKVTLALDATSAAISISESQVQVLSSGTSMPAFSKTFGLARTTRQLMPALMPYSVSLILPESTVPSMNFEVSTLDRSSRALPVAVLGDVGHVHLDDVRGGVAGDLGGQLVPVARPLTRLRGDLHPGVRRGVRGRSPLVVFLLRTSLPHQAKVSSAVPASPPPPAAVAGARSAPRQAHRRCGGGQTQATEQELPAIHAHCLSLVIVVENGFSRRLRAPQLGCQSSCQQLPDLVIGL